MVGCSSDEAGGSGKSVDAGPDAPAPPKLKSNLANLGPLGTPDANGLILPDGFTSRVVATTGQAPLPGGSFLWHGRPDGGATFQTPDGGWIYVSNSEIPFGGGVGALRFDADGNLVDAYAILSDTNVNCAGGKTPWGTWLSCEEIPKGRVFECDPFGKVPAVAYEALGVFKHEAVAVDPTTNVLYLTEDEGDGRFYRFVPGGTRDGRPDLSSGSLEVAQVAQDGSVTWHPLPDPTYTGSTATRLQVPESTEFDGGEGIAWFDGMVFFSTKGDNRVWAFDVAAQKLSVLYDAATASNPILTGVDNVAVSCCGDVLVAEDGGDMQIVMILADGTVKPLLQVTGHDSSEMVGPAFDPSGTRLYFSSQRGSDGATGVTFEVTGPFHLPA